MEEQKLLKRRRKALSENNEPALASVCTDLANLYMEAGKHDLAIQEYSTVSNIYKKQKKMLEYAVVNRGIGEAYLGLQQFDKALQFQTLYLETVKELKNKLEEQRALATIGHTYLSSYLDGAQSHKSSIELANKFFKKSLVVSQCLNGQISKLEMADMSARLFANLGLVQDCLGNFSSASELITKSINLCKAHDLYEQLQRGYMSLASLFIKGGDSKSALQNYNLAAEAAKNLKNKPFLLANILVSKSEMLVKLGDLHGARSALFKAYKLKIPDIKEHQTIETNLRTVASMCITEDRLLVTDSTNYEALKRLYEKMGDGACALKQFAVAVDYYKKMLDAALKAGLTGPDLAPCYYSLAETYKDNGQFDEAVVYFEQELELCLLLKDKLNTLSNIADTKEAADLSIDEVKSVYRRAIELCQKEGNVHEEGRMLKRCIIYLRRQNQHSEASRLEKDLDQLHFVSSESEDEKEEEQNSAEEIDLEALSDVSDDSDLEQSASKPRKRTLRVQRNIKGETQLHTACIKGQLSVVRHLLDQGHPVNVRDNCGWLPLHEACINGHIDVVQVLLEKGAAINDRGGAQCEGVTPLHDAASNGHLHIVKLLLDKGANAVAKTDDGDTVLMYLKKWRETVHLNEDSHTLYESLVDQMSHCLDKVGHMDKTPKNMRRSAIIGLEDEDSSSSPPQSASTNHYRDVMESLRHRKVSPRTLVAKQPALVSCSDVTDDWLLDDVQATKKRKNNSPVKSQSVSMRRSATIGLDDDSESDDCFAKKRKTSSPVKSLSARKSFDENMRRSTSPIKSQPVKKQTKLTNLGHTRTVVEADSTVFVQTTSPKQVTVMEQTLSVDVRIDRKLYRVPVLLSQVNTNTIKWLAEEAAARYARKEYMVPTLELETQNGALLADDDPINVLFPMGSAHAEEVEGRVVKWNVPPLIQRFREACQDMSVVAHSAICRQLEEFSVSLDLSDGAFKGKQLAPLFKALNRQTNLLELNVSGNFLTLECYQLLATSLPTLENLTRLNLKCTGLKSEHLALLANVCEVSDLDVSDNFLCDDTWGILVAMSRKLVKLNLSGNKLKNVPEVALNFSQLQEFDVSDNELDHRVLAKILSWLSFANLRVLNVSRNCARQCFLKDILETCTDSKLEICKLSRCCVNDSDVFDLLRFATSLHTLDLSYNNDLTSVSLRRLLQSNVHNLNLYACQNIVQYFTDFSRYLDDASRDVSRTVKVGINDSCQEKQQLVQMWRDLYGSRAIIQMTSTLLCLSIK